MPSELPDDVIDRIRDALFAGRKIEAIKIYRSATGADLLHSKEFIEGLLRQLQVEFPGRIPEPAGCNPAVAALAIVVLAGAAAAIAWLLNR